MNMRMQFVQRNYFYKKGYKQLLVRNETRAIKFIFILNLFFNFNFFHIFLVEVQNITSADRNRNMHIFYKKKFQS